MARGLEELAQALIAGLLPQRTPSGLPGAQALTQARGGRPMGPGGPAPRSWLEGGGPMAARGEGINVGEDAPEWQAGADVLTQAMRARGHGIDDAVLIGQGTRGAGPNALIEAREGAGRPQQTLQLGNKKYHVWFDEHGKRQVRVWRVGSENRRRLL